MSCQLGTQKETELADGSAMKDDQTIKEDEQVHYVRRGHAD